MTFFGANQLDTREVLAAMAAKKFKRPETKKTWKYYLTSRRCLSVAGLVVLGIALLGLLIYANIKGSIGYNPWDVAGDFARYRQLLERWRAAQGHYPTEVEGGLAALVEVPVPGSDTPCLAELIRTPAGGEYQYSSDGERFMLLVRLGGRDYQLSSADSARTEAEIYQLLVSR